MTAARVLAQSRTITGSVKSDENGRVEPLPGVNVVADGTTTGTLTDAEGNFSLEVPQHISGLTFSFIGFKSQTVDIGEKSVIDVLLESEVKALEEVIVVGYGTQKVKDLTSAIVTVNMEDIAKSPAGQPLQALQGKVSGVQVVSNGRPGGLPTIRVRGVGSYPENSTGEDKNISSEPLYVVDGMLFYSIEFLNMADIASISVLKDASASAIYGVRAANGVVLITTKAGHYNRKPEITYDGYYGVQVAQNVLKMANAAQYTQMAKEATDGNPKNTDYSYVLLSMQRFGRSRVNPNVPDVNTDWYKEILRMAPVQNHSFGVSGGGNKTTYSIGASYFGQDGLANMKNKYERMNLRSKIDFKVSDLLTVGGNAIFTRSSQFKEPEEIWAQAYYASPLFPVWDPLNEGITSPKAYGSAANLAYRDGQNPFPLMDTRENRIWVKNIMANFYISLDLIPNKLNFKTKYNAFHSSQQERETKLPYFLSTNSQHLKSELTRKSKIVDNQFWDNILTYTNNWGEHNLTAMGGVSYRREEFQLLQARGQGFPTAHQNGWYIHQSPTIVPEGVDDDGRDERGFSYFGRLAYNYKDKYLAYATFRADGTSKYQQKWGYFPAFGAGWVISEEEFMKGKTFLDFLKLRAGWGVLGNDKIISSSGTNTTEAKKFISNGVLMGGLKSKNTFNFLTWESTIETNIGVTARSFRDRLSLDLDYYIRDTHEAAFPLIIPGSSDADPFKNIGLIRNTGLELGLNWEELINDKLGYTIGINLAVLKNVVRDLKGAPYANGGSAEFRQRSYVGQPLNAFYGYKVLGVYQSKEEIGEDAVARAGGVVAGDLKYQDTNGDGVITDDDRVVLGSYFPSLNWGLQAGAHYRNLELSVSFMGQHGNKILNRKRGQMLWTTDGNMDADLANNRWHGAGTSNKYPSSPGLRRIWNQKMSDYFVEDGGFLRIQNVQLAYHIKQWKWGKMKWPDVRFYVTADRPYTRFTYNGFTTEVANGTDQQTYPVPATYTAGVSVKF